MNEIFVRAIWYQVYQDIRPLKDDILCDVSLDERPFRCPRLKAADLILVSFSDKN